MSHGETRLYMDINAIYGSSLNQQEPVHLVILPYFSLVVWWFLSFNFLVCLYPYIGYFVLRITVPGNSLLLRSNIFAFYLLTYLHCFSQFHASFLTIVQVKIKGNPNMDLKNKGTSVDLGNLPPFTYKFLKSEKVRIISFHRNM